MTLTISISPDAEAKLRAKAADAGVDIETYAAKALEQIAARPSLDEILKPLHAEFDASGMTEDQLSNLLEETKHEARANRKVGRSS